MSSLFHLSSSFAWHQLLCRASSEQLQCVPCSRQSSGMCARVCWQSPCQHLSPPGTVHTQSLIHSQHSTHFHRGIVRADTEFVGGSNSVSLLNLYTLINEIFVQSGITGSALALHCCKAHAKINGKIENSTSCKIVTHEDFNLKLGTRDYVADATHHATLGSNRHSGGFPPSKGNITPVWLLVILFFSIQPPGRTVALIVTLNGSNDVFPPKDGPFGGQDDGWRHLGEIFPKNSPKRGVNRQFQAKTPKFLHRNISGTINPTK